MTNVLVLRSDEHNPRYSSPYGHDVVRTPHMERLAERGTTFENAYCPSPLCVPSRTAFLTGRRSHEVQAYNNSKAIERRHLTYADVMSEQGVHSVYVGGGSNLYRDPFALGFDEMLSVRRTGRAPSTHAVRAEGPAGAAPRRTAEHGPVDGVYGRDEEHIDAAVRWLRETAPVLGAPWTVTIDIHPPHPPYTTEPRYWEMYDGDLPEHGADEESARHPYAQDIRDNGRWAYDDDLVRDLRRGYFGAVTFVDDQLGRLLDAVDSAGLTEDTVVAYTSDHGEMLGTFGLWGKTSLYEDSVRVPLVVAGPGFAPGARVRTPVTTLDLQAAMFDAVGAARPSDWRGEPLQRIPADDVGRVAFASYHGHNVRAGGYLVRRGDWKLLYNVAAPHQLFDLADDPHELVNLWSDRPDVAASLESELREICDPEAVERDAEAVQEEQLEAVRRLREEFGDDVGLVPWEEAPA